MLRPPSRSLVFPDGQPVNEDLFVTYVSDDANSLLEIQKVVEKGALGLQFEVDMRDSGVRPDNLGGLDGFASIESQDGTMCRTFCRRICWPIEPFDRLDNAVYFFIANEGSPPVRRAQMFLVGCFGLALNLVKANKSLTLNQEDQHKLDELLEAATELRKENIELFTFPRKTCMTTFCNSIEDSGT